MKTGTKILIGLGIAAVAGIGVAAALDWSRPQARQVLTEMASAAINGS